jgi:hypothetical protein
MVAYSVAWALGSAAPWDGSVIASTKARVVCQLLSQRRYSVRPAGVIW